MNALIIGRAVAGLGGSGLYLGCLTLVEVTTSIRQRPIYMAFTGISKYFLSQTVDMLLTLK